MPHKYATNEELSVMFVPVSTNKKILSSQGTVDILQDYLISSPPFYTKNIQPSFTDYFVLDKHK